MKADFLKKHLAVILSFVFLTIVYVLHAPHTVQTGDSGEFAAAAYALLVPHPPGYPLWVWLNHAWSILVQIDTPYFSFSLFNIIISLATLFFLTSFIRSTPLKVFLVLTLGLSAIYWKFSLIPEVFYLNLLLTIMVIYFGISENKWRNTDIPIAATMMPLVYSLSVANHHTTLFMMPFVLWVCWKYRKSKWLYLSISAGIAICTSLYLSMMLMNPEHRYSWGKILTASDVLHHFLRKDYGTFDLARQKVDNALPFLLDFFQYHFFKTTAPFFILFLVTLLVASKEKRKLLWDCSQTTVTACLLAYLFIFLPLMQMAPINEREEVVERFILLPIILVTFLLTTFVDKNFNIKSTAKSAAVYIAAILFSLSSIIIHSRNNDYSDNTIVSDHGHNILNISAEFKNPLILIGQDTQLFGARYAQVVENIQPQILVMPRVFFANEIAVSKIQKELPLLKYDYAKIKRDNKTEAIRDLVEPDESNFTIITDEDEFPYEVTKVTYLPLGIIISKGVGVHFLKSKYVPQFRSDTSIIVTDPDKFDLFRNVISKYTYYFMAQAYVENQAGNTTKAIDNYERALGIFPYSYTALKNLCTLKTKRGIADIKCNHTKEAENYFDYYKFGKGN